MDIRTMEKLAVNTSLLGFGCMRFPLLEENRINEELSEQMLMEAYRCGVNYFDTAYPYHEQQSELFTGRVLDKLPRESYYLATKLPCWDVQTLQDAKDLFETQMKRLNKEYVDFYLLHSLSGKSWDKMLSLGVVEYCEQLKSEGRIRHFGFSFHDSYESFERILTYRDWDFCQIQLNYMDTEEQAGMKGYELAEGLNIPVIVMEPVKGGSLAVLPDDIYETLNVATSGLTPSAWAIRWAGSLPNVKVILSGMSDLEQVRDNCRTCTEFDPLSEQEQEAVTKAAEMFRGRLRNGCTQCRYCMPCPAGVDIPQNFQIWNEYAMFRNLGHIRWRWNVSIPATEKAENCIDCGLCEEVCPQKLPVREHLKLLQAELDEATKE